ncbi:hypothetical protein DV589_22585 [Salmonella enterica]|nr:hypothetical protein [Salmonella enterica]
MGITMKIFNCSHVYTVNTTTTPEINCKRNTAHFFNKIKNVKNMVATGIRNVFGHRRVYTVNTTTIPEINGKRNTAHFLNKIKNVKNMVATGIRNVFGHRRVYTVNTTTIPVINGKGNTAQNYEAVWSAWKRAAPPEEVADRTSVIEQLHDIRDGKKSDLVLHNLNISSLPDCLPPTLTEISIHSSSLTTLPALPDGLERLYIPESPLTALPALPDGLRTLVILNTPLTALPALPDGLERLNISKSPLTALPALPDGLRILEISNSPLTELPALPDGLERLYISKSPLTALPALPDGLRTLDISDTPLTELPALPDGLRTLDISDTPLTELPALPDGLRTLHISDTPLTELPALPDGLKRLFISESPLTALPALPDGLELLFISDIPLTALPALPDGLEDLLISDTPLTALPEIPGGVMEMRVNYTAITSLPESITRLSPHASVDISSNPLSARTLQTLQAITCAPGYSGPQIFFSMPDFSSLRETRPLHQAVADWLMPTEDGGPAPADIWQSFEQENDAASFSAFLDRLNETQNSQKAPGFKAQVSAWLTRLAEDNKLRAKTFAMAAEATSSCEDRVTLALNQMKNVQLVHDAESGVYDNNIPGLVSVGREMFRLEKLEQIARDKVNTLSFVDEIEVYLGYQNKLKEPLELSSVTEAMRFFDVSRITESDLQTAEVQVKAAENSQFREWILKWSPLHNVLKHSYPEEWEKLVEKKASDYNNAYQALSDSELKAAGLTGDDDARRTIGVRARESMEQAFHAGIRVLVDRIIPAEYLEARWF